MKNQMKFKEYRKVDRFCEEGGGRRRREPQF